MVPRAAEWARDSPTHLPVGFERWSTLQAVYPISDARRAFWLASLALLPLFVWWLGWFPAFVSSDSLDQLRQIETGEYTNGHPAFHTITLWAITRVWNNPGAISLVQIIVLALLLGLIAKRLQQLGVPVWLVVGTAWLVALSPAVGPTSITLWKDVAFTAAFLWVFAELLMLARLSDAYWRDPWNPARLGSALSLLWLYRHNGFLTVLGLLAVLAIVNRRNLGRLIPTVLTTVGIVLIVQGPVFWLFTVDRITPAAAEVLLPAVASSLVHEPGNFSADDLELLTSIAPLEVWRSRYDCASADALLFDPSMGIDVIRQDPAPVLGLGIRTLLRDLDTSLGFFWCRASFLLIPDQPENSYLSRPQFGIPANDQGIERSPVWSAAYDGTREIFFRAGSDSWLWLTWRPALVIWSMLAAYAALARRRTRMLLLPGSLLGIHLLNVAATSLNHEFRLAFPLYVAGILSLPLLWFVRHPDRLTMVSARRALPDDDVAPVRAGKRQFQRVE